MANENPVISNYIWTGISPVWIRDIDTQYWNGERTLYEGVDEYPAKTVVRLTNMRMIVAYRTGGFFNAHYAMSSFGYEDMDYPDYFPGSKGEYSCVRVGCRSGRLLEFYLYSRSDARNVMKIIGEQVHRFRSRVYMPY